MITTKSPTKSPTKKKTPTPTLVEALKNRIMAAELDRAGVILLCFKDNPSGPSIVHSSSEDLPNSLTYLTNFLFETRGSTGWIMPGCINSGTAGILPASGIVSPAIRKQTAALLKADDLITESITGNWNHLLLSFDRGRGGVMRYMAGGDRASTMRTVVEWLQRHDRFETWMHSCA